MKKRVPKADIACDADTFRAITDALQTLSGSWKLPILLALKDGPQRFRQLAKAIPGISDKMLSKELKNLEENHLITRTAHETFPPTVEYAKTEYADTLYEVMLALRNWGKLHQRKIRGK